MGRRVLLVSFDFPPIGGGGVQRNVKFLKYLDRLGWDTMVLTVKERSYYVYDYSLLREIPNTEIYRSRSNDLMSIFSKLKNYFSKSEGYKEPARTREDIWYVALYRVFRNWFLFPDGQVGWIRNAVKLGNQLCVSDKRPDVIIATFPIPTNVFVAEKLASRFNIPFIIDYRDGWRDDPSIDFVTRLHYMYHSYCESYYSRRASALIVYGESLRDILIDRYNFKDSHVTVIKNGFDEEDFAGIKPKSKNKDKIRIVYSGSIYIDRRQSFKYFLLALSKLDTVVREMFEVYFVGDDLEWAKREIENQGLSELIFFTGYKEHEEALSYLASGDIFLLFLKPGDRIALTGKVFEYIYYGRPIFALAEPDGALGELLASLRNASICVSPNDLEGITTNFLQILKFAKINDFPKVALSSYSRNNQSLQLEKVLNKVISL